MTAEMLPSWRDTPSRAAIVNCSRAITAFALLLLVPSEPPLVRL
jgi:hypothetical protein